MSQSVGSVYRENRDRSGLLRLAFGAESVFGCPIPPKPPFQNMFPGEEEGAPESAPSPLLLSDGEPPSDIDDPAPPDTGPDQQLLALDLHAFLAQQLLENGAQGLIHQPTEGEVYGEGVLPPYYPSDEEE